MSAPAIIRTESLTRTFGDVRAVDALDLEIPAGTVFGFLGPNGAGKTTTIRLLLGLLEPTSGRASVLGFDTRSQGGAIREKSGALLEHHGLYERLSAEDNLAFYARVWRLARAARDERIRGLLEPLGLWERRREPVARWSRGMKQKLAVARALLHRPSLLFLDEPTAGLDPMAAATLREELGDAGSPRRRHGVPDDAQPGRSRAALRARGGDQAGQAARGRPPGRVEGPQRDAGGDRRAGIRRAHAVDAAGTPGRRAREPAERAHRAGTGQGRQTPRRWWR